MKFSLRSVECGLALLMLMGTAVCRGWEGNPIELKRMPWFGKRGFTPLQLYTSSDLVGQGRLEAFRIISAGDNKEKGFAVLSMAFTNVLKGVEGRCDVYVNDFFKDPERSDLTTGSDEVPEFETENILKDDWKWKVGKSYILICVSNPAMSRWELHSVVLQEWPDYVRILREKVREYGRWKAEKAARERVISLELSDYHDSMRLGDISSAEYEKHFDEYRKMREAIDQEYQRYPIPCFPDGADGRFGGPIDWGRLKGEFGGAQ